MSLEDNKAILRAHVEALFNQHRVEQTDESFTQDYLDHAPLPGQAPGLASAKQKWTSYLTAVPDMHATIEDMIAEGTSSRCAGPPRAHPSGRTALLKRFARSGDTGSGCGGSIAA